MPQRRKAKKPSTVQARQPHLVDTNVILRFLIGDDPPKAARAAALLEQVERSAEILEISTEVLTETVWTLESFYKVPRAEAAQRLAALISLPGMRSSAREIMLEALESYSRSTADFVDCLLVARSKRQKMPVYTFDVHDFKKLSAEWETP